MSQDVSMFGIYTFVHFPTFDRTLVLKTSNLLLYYTLNVTLFSRVQVPMVLDAG